MEDRLLHEQVEHRSAFEFRDRAARNTGIGWCATTRVGRHAPAWSNLLGVTKLVLDERRSRVDENEVRIGNGG
jgi:hypothetical protein